jgi:tRNA nucleotidyltransferase (CCA-adding enzyme)
MQELVARVDAVVPAEVREVCRVLIEAGFEAVTVGGAVRDALLGRDAGDWDVASSAKPDEVVALFPRTIPTGIQHGTVTVMVGRGERRIGVEVTTFRGEGAYSDARRPDSVTFGVPLDEDLARRDLVVNAIAYDPIAHRLHDPFGGLADIAARRLRAVGDPVARFTEDGLRVMRAVRFAAVLEFALDPATEAAIPIALGSLRKVSQERIQIELAKLLAAPRPSLGLVIAHRTSILSTILPELTSDPWPWVDAAPLDARPAALLATVDAKLADAALRRLKFSNEDRDRTVKLIRVALADATDAPAVRRLLAAVGRPLGPLLTSLWSSRTPPGPHLLARDILARGDALALGDLALTGNDLMSELGLPPGRALGQLLAALLDRVLDDPALNTRPSLLALATQLR